MIHALPLAHAAIAQLYVYAFGLTMTTFICSKNDMACCHCWPFPQPSMILLYVITSGKQLSSLMSAKSCKLQRHWLVLPKRLIALLNLKVSISDFFATETIQSASGGLQMWSGQEQSPIKSACTSHQPRSFAWTQGGWASTSAGKLRKIAAAFRIDSIRMTVIHCLSLTKPQAVLEHFPNFVPGAMALRAGGCRS